MKNLIIKYKPQLYYMLFGVITTIIDVALFMLCIENFTESTFATFASYTIAWFVSTAFSFITNKFWVYGSRSMKAVTFMKEAFAYFTGRGVSYIVGFTITYVGINLMEWSEFLMKIVSDIVVVIINYGFGFLVFKRLEENMEEQ